MSGVQIPLPRPPILLSHQVGPPFKQAVLNGKIMLGMTTDMVRASWGEPNDINQTVTADYVREQWVYGDFGPYVYFLDGILNSWQD